MDDEVARIRLFYFLGRSVPKRSDDMDRFPAFGQQPGDMTDIGADSSRGEGSGRIFRTDDEVSH